VKDFQLLPGINIQWPWSQLLLSGKKIVETRSYALPKKYEGQALALIETPGPFGLKQAGITEARIIGIITFSESFRYLTKKAWAADQNRHLVKMDDPSFAYDSSKPKWGWVVSTVVPFEKPVAAPVKKGIVFSSNCRVPNLAL
jgi:hypothetical protein